jgi:hypothetical protein
MVRLQMPTRLAGALQASPNSLCRLGVAPPDWLVPLRQL